MVIEYGERDGAEVECPVLVIELFESDDVADECFADEEHFALPADTAGCAHMPERRVCTVLDLRLAQRVGALRGHIDAGGSMLPEGFVWAEVVVVVPEAVEDVLLGGDVGLRRLRGILLECTMHSLVPAVLFGVSGFYTFGPYAEPDPPDGKWRQASKSGAGERRAVVCPDDPWQAIFSKRGHPYWFHGVGVNVMERLTSKQGTTVVVGDGERMAAPAVSKAEVALEICAPDIVGHAWLG